MLLNETMAIRVPPLIYFDFFPSKEPEKKVSTVDEHYLKVISLRNRNKFSKALTQDLRAAHGCSVLFTEASSEVVSLLGGCHEAVLKERKPGARTGLKISTNKSGIMNSNLWFFLLLTISFLKNQIRSLLLPRWQGWCGQVDRKRADLRK